VSASSSEDDRDDDDATSGLTAGYHQGEAGVSDWNGARQRRLQGRKNMGLAPVVSQSSFVLKSHRHRGPLNLTGGTCGSPLLASGWYVAGPVRSCWRLSWLRLAVCVFGACSPPAGVQRRSGLRFGWLPYGTLTIPGKGRRAKGNEREREREERWRSINNSPVPQL
jgi:hypothetical protein